MTGTRAGTALIAGALAALVCVAAALATPSKLTLRIDGVSHTHLPTGTLLCARISGTAGSTLLVEAYGAGLPEQHAFTEAVLPARGPVLVGFTITAPGPYRIKVTANKKKVGRSIAVKDYVVPEVEIAARGRFACA